MPDEPRFRIPVRRPSWASAAAGLALLVVLLGGLLVGGLALGSDDDDERGTTVETRAIETVPSVVGLTRARAAAMLARSGLGSAYEQRRSRKPAGRVLVQKPRAGSRVERGVAILLVVSSGESQARPGEETEQPAAPKKKKPLPRRPTDTVIVEAEPPLSEVPGVLEIGFVDAARVVEGSGYVADTYVVASQRPRGLVIRQRPAPGTQLARGRTVRLYVATGPGVRRPARLDDFTGLPEAEARDLLQRAGFTVRTIDRAAPSRRRIGAVLFQRPGGGRFLPVLSQVTLYVGR